MKFKKNKQHSRITHILNKVIPKTIRWCTPSIHLDKALVVDFYKGDMSVSYNSLGFPYEPSGIFKEAYTKAAEVYGADSTLFCVNGSTGSNFIVLRSLKKQIANIKILAQRNIHRSILVACEDYFIDLMFLPISIDSRLHFFLPNTVDEILEHLSTLRPDVLLLTNPTYEGITLDLKRLIREVRKHYKDLIIFIEEAWGSHLHFSKKLPISAMEAGADICIQSTHKQGGALQQTSMIHWKEGRINSNILLDSYKDLSTSSPSYSLLASLDAAREVMERDGEKKIGRLIKISEELSAGIESIPGFRIVSTEELKSRNPSVYDRDKTKIIVDVLESGYTGYDIARILEKKYRVIVEKFDGSTILFLTPFQSTEKDVETTIKALQNIANEKRERKQNNTVFSKISLPRNIIKRMGNREIANLKDDQVKKIPFKKAVGKIAAENITPYPPGIPTTIKGEELSKEIMNFYNELKKYSNCKIISTDPTLKSIFVVK